MGQKDLVKEREMQERLMDSIVHLIPDNKIGKELAIDTFTVNRKQVKNAQMRAAWGGMDSYEQYYDFKPGKYKRLSVNGKTMMSTTQMERRTNREIIANANGHVLIAGLGLGMILLPIQAKKEVKSITVVELDKRIIKMVAPYLPNEKITFIHKDICRFKTDEIFDTIYFDIWQTIDSENWELMKVFGRQFRKNLNKDNPNAWLGHWMKDKVQRMAAEERKSDKEREMWSAILGGGLKELSGNLKGLKV